MGQKVNPHGLRVGVIKDWDSKWYANKKNFADFLIEDNKIREHIKKKLYTAGISRIVIERNAGKVLINIETAKPGAVIGKNGAVRDELTAELKKLTGKDTINVSVFEIKNPDLDAQLCAENIASQLEKRTSFRKAMKSVMQRTMRAGALGIKAACGGRLGGAEIARTEQYHEGTIPADAARRH